MRCKTALNCSARVQVKGLFTNKAWNAVMREKLVSLLEDCMARGQEIALVHRRGLRAERWSYARLAQVAFQFARELEARGIGQGDRVLCWSENCAEWVAAFFGCLLRGVIVVPLDEQSAPDFVTRVQAQVKAKLLLCGTAQQKHASTELPSLLVETLCETLSAHSTAKYEAVGIGTDELAEIIFTSGTTAEPKGVCLSQRNLLANIAPLEEEIDKYRRWERPFHPVRFLNLLPLSHVFGQFMGVFVPQLLGGEVHFQDTLNPSEIIATVKRERISVIAAVPRQLETLRDKLERDYAAQGKLEKFQKRFAKAEGEHFIKRWWRFRDVHRRFGWKFWAFVAGGATLEEETESFWQRLGFAVVQGYGMTETASLVSVNHPFKLSRGSIGKVLPGQEIKLGENGEILVRGANISAGYWRDGLQPLSGDAGWLRTGDVGAVDEAGNLYFKGRQKDVIVTAAGLNIYPEDLEAALNRQPEVRASCVIGVAGARGPEAVAVLILRDKQADAAQIVERANMLLSQAQQMRRWVIWREPDFPRTPTHKVRKNLVKDALEDEAETSSVKRPPAQPLLEILAGISQQPISQLAESANLSRDLKLDSLGRVELASALEDRFQIELDEAAITSATTLADLERLVQNDRPAAQVAAYPYPRWALRWPVRWLRLCAYYLLILPITRLLCWVGVRGREHLRELRGPVLFIANHVSMVDHGLILSALPWRFRHRLAIAMDGERLRGWRSPPRSAPWPVRWWLRVQYALVVMLFNVFPLPQQSGFRRSFAYAGEAVDCGYDVLVFPEGRTTDDGQMRPFMAGIGLLAAQLGVPLVPVKLTGLFELKRRKRYWAWPGSVTIAFGPPVKFERGAEPAEITRELEARVQM
jgi:long-chain acyl-CoA synthetase